MTESSPKFEYQVEQPYNDLKIKEYLKAKDFSELLIKKVKYDGKVFLNGKMSKLYHTVSAGDIIIIDLGKESVDMTPEDIPLNIVYEDDDILVVNKAPFMVTHPSKRHPRGTLANAVAFYFLKHGIESKIRFVNRLDKNTSGIIIISKNLLAHNYVQKQIKEGSVKKVYWAIVEGHFFEKQGNINVPIGRESPLSIMRSVMENGKCAVTYYEILEEFVDASLVKLVPKTGRTHQLRVHMQYSGHPILGDDLYNMKSSQFIERQALHAREIEFILPRNKEKMMLTAPLSDDIKHLIFQLKER